MAISGDTEIQKVQTELGVLTSQMTAMQRTLETVAQRVQEFQSALSRFTTEQAVAAERASADRAALAALQADRDNLRERISELEDAYKVLVGQGQLLRALVWIIPTGMTVVGYIVSKGRP